MAQQKFNITNWKSYNNALITRGSLTCWGDETALHAWYC
ncbi:MAG: IS5/IS1182 family transposase, partial [Serratia symbiotica]|nr:IS5/IS1182 family transposase [Serratia symbiotica]